VTRLPRTGSYLIDPLLLAVEAILFTALVTLAVGASALLLWATLSTAGAYTRSARASSLLALLVFVTCIAGPTYLLVAASDDADRAEGDESCDGERA
jgi:hypothetical protein